MLCWCLLYNSLNLKIQLLSHVQLSTPGFFVLHYLLEFAQLHVRWVGDAIPTISSSAAPFSFCLLSSPASRSFPMSHIRWPKYWSFSISPSNIHYSGWFPLGLTRLISLQCKELSKISCMYTYIPSPPAPMPTSPSSRWSRSSLCGIAASHYLSILHMVVWKIFLRGKILIVIQKSQDLDSFVISKYFFLIPIFLSANTSEFYF